MHPHEWEHISYSGQQHDIANLRLKLFAHLVDELIFTDGRMDLLQKIFASFSFLHIRYAVQNVQVLADLDKQLIEIAFNQMTIKIWICNQLIQEMRHCHFIFRRITEEADIDLIR